MTTEQDIKNVMVVGATIYDHMSGPQQAWIGMIEQVLHSKGYFPEFEEFAKLADELKISQASKKELKTFWWDKYQWMVREIGSVLSSAEQ